MCVPDLAAASAMPIGVAISLAAQWAPEVNAGTLLAFARYESGLDPYVVHDNSTGQSFHPATAEAATALASVMLTQGHSLDLGIMQVNSTNLLRTGMTVASAFDPGQSIRAGAQILVAAYQQCRHGGQVEPQAALRCAASVYNTGREQAGILNGYQASVWRVASQIVPAIQFAAGGIGPLLPSPSPDADVDAPMPRRLPAGLWDTLHVSPSVLDTNDDLVDALHAPSSPVQPEEEIP